MALDPHALNAAFFNVLKSDSAGATVRAALGAGAASVVHRADLNKATLPTAPFLALQVGPITGARYQVQTLFFTWWIYDDGPRRWGRINSLIPLMRVAYPKEAIAYASVDIPSIGGEITDGTLALPARSIQYSVKVRQQ